MPPNRLAHSPVEWRPSHATVTRLSPVPLSSTSRCLSLSLFHGLSRSILNALASALTMLVVHPESLASDSPHTATAPSRSERVGSGTTRAGSAAIRSPRPLHSTHMPSGELNEKLCGDSSGKPMPHLGHALASEYTRVPFSSATSTISLPLPSRSAVSTESVSRPLSFELIVRRSITSSIECFFCFSSASTSSSRTIMPSIRTRTKPALRSSRNSSRNSPLRFSALGARRGDALANLALAVRGFGREQRARRLVGQRGELVDHLARGARSDRAAALV